MLFKKTYNLIESINDFLKFKKKRVPEKYITKMLEIYNKVKIIDTPKPIHSPLIYDVDPLKIYLGQEEGELIIRIDSDIEIIVERNIKNESKRVYH